MRSDSMFVEAAKEDVPEIIALRHQIWGTTYRGIYPDDMIDNFDWAWHQEKELLRINDPAYSVYLLQKDDQNIGYLTISRTDGIVLQSLYILSEYQRQGIGRAAFDFIRAYCREHGAKSKNLILTGTKGADFHISALFLSPRHRQPPYGVFSYLYLYPPEKCIN